MLGSSVTSGSGSVSVAPVEVTLVLSSSFVTSHSVSRSLSMPSVSHSLSHSQLTLSDLGIEQDDLDLFLNTFSSTTSSVVLVRPQSTPATAPPPAAAAVPFTFEMESPSHHMRLVWLLLMESWGLITPLQRQELSDREPVGK